jgi:CRISPR-associated protein Cmr6
MATLSRRKNLNVQFDSSFHAGLWMDRYIEKLHRKNDKENFYTDHFQQVTQSIEPPFYARFYEEWQRALQASGAVYHEATVQGRMAVGLGDESVLETSVALHHTYGVPYIPGSALKGLAASFVRQWLENETAWGTWEQDENGKKQAWKPGTAYKIVFGNTDTAGYITFFDALYVPGTGYNGHALYPDIITVHHKEYYGSGNTPPADWDNPKPVPFLSATGNYLIALAGRADWVGVVFKLLARALAEMGIGAKTSSGYGRMKLEGAEQSAAGPI